MIYIIEHEHDSGYKGLFSKKKNFIHFIKKYIKADWVNEIDEKDLELVNVTFIEADYKDRESDVIYKMKFQDSEIIFYILLELQSTVNQTMPFRLLKYMTELMKREFDNTPKNARESIDYKLPAVIPIILYNGANKWTVVKTFKEYLQGYSVFGEYIIDFRYFLFDLNRTTDETIRSTDELLDIIFLLDKKASRASMERALNVAVEEFRRMGEDDKTSMIRWIQYILLNHVEDDGEKEALLSDFEKGEVTHMIYGIDRAFEEERLKGRKEGKREGKVEGKHEGRLEEKRETIFTLDGMGMPLAQISTAVRLTEKEVEDILKDKKSADNNK